MTALDWTAAAAWRMERHGLAARAPVNRAVDVVAGIAGLHAQLMASAELSLWARVEPVDRATLRQLLWARRELVRTWAMRGTLHLLPSAEYGLWQAALAAYDHYLKPAWFKAFGITREELERLVAAVADALDGPPLTRDALAASVAESTGSPELGEKLRESWGAYLKPASFRGVLCFAPDQGRNVSFTRPDRWLGPLPVVDRDAALAEVTRRYLGAYGPARREDYARWWGCSPATAGRRIRALGDEVAEVVVEGAPALMLARHADVAAAAEPAARVRLLPSFDPYVVGASRDPSGVVPEAERGRIYRRAGGWMSPVVLVDGRMAGVWRHAGRGKRLQVEVEAFERLARGVREALEDEVARLAVFLGGRPVLEIRRG